MTSTIHPCSMCGADRVEEQGVTMCAHCDQSCGQSGCPTCTAAIFYAGVGPGSR